MSLGTAAEGSSSQTLFINYLGIIYHTFAFLTRGKNAIIKPMDNKKINANFIRVLAGLWGILTYFLFIVDFFTKNITLTVTSTSSVIYGVILALYVSNKEINRWQSKKGQFKSLHFGEIYPVIWSIALFFFIIITAINPDYFKIPAEFPATYITILGIYIISHQSKTLYKKRAN